jgi:hypothetical protein
MQYTLLEIVQIILSSMDSDEVNSISDTVESNQVALLLKQCYYDVSTDIGLRSQEGLFELLPSGDPTKPVLMTLPSNVAELTSVRYNNKEDADTQSNYVGVDWVPFHEFFERQNNLDPSLSNVASMSFQSNGDTFEIGYYTDRHPSIYTDIGGSTLLFDAFQDSLDTTLQKSKTLCTGVVYPAWEMTDTFVPDLSPAHFSYYINKAKARAFVELKQMNNADASGEARRQKIILQARDKRVNIGPEINRVPKYGRK